jgi:hypothetical protein
MSHNQNYFIVSDGYTSYLAEGEELGSNLLHVIQSSLGDPGGPGGLREWRPAGDRFEAALGPAPTIPGQSPGVAVEAKKPPAPDG